MSRKYFKDKTIVSLLSDAQSLYGHLRSAYAYYNKKHKWSITIDENDEAYFFVKAWVVDQVGADVRHPNVFSSRRGIDGTIDRKMYFTPASRESSVVQVGEFRVSVKFLNGGKPPNEGLSDPGMDPYDDQETGLDSNENSGSLYDSIVFTCQSQEAFDLLKVKLSALYEESWLTRQSSACRLFLWTGSYWAANSDLDLDRSVDSVILVEGQLERLLADLEKFVESEDKYVSRGVPWHRGYILHGPPGTGKTSVVRALASQFQMDLYYLSLSDITSDSILLDAVAKISRKSMLVLEDVDIALPSLARDASRRGVSLATFLNVLDGLVTPHGLITFITTNFIDKLDTALIRKGRMDVSEHVGNPTNDQVERLWALFFPEEDSIVVSLPEGDTKSTSFFYDILKRHMEDPDSAYAEIAAYCSGAVVEEVDEVLEEFMAEADRAVGLPTDPDDSKDEMPSFNYRMRKRDVLI